jgi:hypothetical protein
MRTVALRCFGVPPREQIEPRQIGGLDGERRQGRVVEVQPRQLHQRTDLGREFTGQCRVAPERESRQLCLREDLRREHADARDGQVERARQSVWSHNATRLLRDRPVDLPDRRTSILPLRPALVSRLDPRLLVQKLLRRDLRRRHHPSLVDLASQKNARAQVICVGLSLRFQVNTVRRTTSTFSRYVVISTRL